MSTPHREIQGEGEKKWQRKRRINSGREKECNTIPTYWIHAKCHHIVHPFTITSKGFLIKRNIVFHRMYTAPYTFIIQSSPPNSSNLDSNVPGLPLLRRWWWWLKMGRDAWHCFFSNEFFRQYTDSRRRESLL